MRESASITSFRRREALRPARKTYPQLTQNLPFNPLPASYKLTPMRAEVLKAISADVRRQKFPASKRSRTDSRLSKRILSVARVIESCS